jgi:sugar diacid utilization regulator
VFRKLDITSRRALRDALDDPSHQDIQGYVCDASRRLYVHYNTLKNRLDRIENIIGPVVTDAARALECEVAIYVDRHYDVPWEPKNDPEL